MLRILLISMLLVACRGPEGIQGGTGERGLPGESIVGPTGPAGSPGQDGTSVVPVQLCPGTPTYPSIFIEVGYCISGKLYAVYSAKDGFLTYLPDGEYSSDAIGSRCTFTVSGCTVTDL